MQPKSNIRIKTSYVSLIIIEPSYPSSATAEAEIERECDMQILTWSVKTYLMIWQVSLVQGAEKLSDGFNFQFKDDNEKENVRGTVFFSGQTGSLSGRSLSWGCNVPFAFDRKAQQCLVCQRSDPSWRREGLVPLWPIWSAKRKTGGDMERICFDENENTDHQTTSGTHAHGPDLQ